MNILQKRLSTLIAKEPEVFAWMIIESQGDLTVYYKCYAEEFGKNGPVLLADPD